jgi:hypothetical protein
MNLFYEFLYGLFILAAVGVRDSTEYVLADGAMVGAGIVYKWETS